MRVVPRGRGAKGTWWLFKGRPTLSCPTCGWTARLDDEHRVQADGTVSPSVQCSNGGCGFHETVQLEGWESDAG